MSAHDLIKNLHRETNKLDIRPYIKEDFDSWLKVQEKNTALLYKMSDTEKSDFLSQKNYSKEVNLRRDLAKQAKAYCLACFQKSNHELLCEVWIKNIFKEKYNSCYVEVDSFNRKWGQVYSLEAISNVFEMCFFDLNLNRVEMFYIKNNLEYRDILLRLSMRSEGISKERLLKENKYIDAEVFALTKTEWQNKGVFNLKNISVDIET